MDPSLSQPVEHVSSPPPQTSLSDLLYLQYDLQSSCVTPLLEDQVPPEMDTLSLPPSRSENGSAPVPFQQQPSLSQLPSHPPYLTPTNVTSQTPLTHMPTPTVLTTPSASPLSIPTTTPPFSVHPTTPQTTPNPSVPLTSAPPLPNHVSLITAAIGYFARYSAENHYAVALDQARTIAKEKKIQERRKLKRSTPPMRSNGLEAHLSRYREKQYSRAIEDQLRLWIQYACDLSRYIEQTHLTPE